ncbi:MAG: methionine--tRNA ligase, partial [Deltaproteobacteria bacterium]|nr:methionine--tRNA ligase [Deltaproteobacteria bacterium]
DLAAVTQGITQLAEEGNLYMQQSEPWKVAREDEEQARSICTAAANFGMILAIYLRPILPEMVGKIEKMLGTGSLSFADLGRRIEDTEIGEFERLAERLELKQMDALVEASRKIFESDEAESVEPHVPLAEECSIDDFSKVDMRVAEILEASEVEGAKKLLQLKVGLGPLGTRQVFAGIRSSYPDPKVLVGRKVICVANLKPRKMRFGLSEGMVCASSAPKESDDDRLRVIMADPEANPGDRVS